MPDTRGEATEDDELEVNASPDKRFFIYMLVKDIDLIPAILDLVDNSVDAARSIRGTESLDGLEVALTVNEDAFEISDTCGGLEAKIARDYAFRFGRPGDFDAIEGSVGQFGIGLKRALFKIGKHFEVESLAPQSRWSMSVPVPSWAKDEAQNWTFRFDSLDKSPAADGERLGVSIRVTDLNPAAKEDFGTIDFEGRLREALRLRHEDALRRGLQVTLNDTKLAARVQHLLESDEIKPIHRKKTIELKEGTVELDLLAGISPGVEHESAKDDDDGAAFTEPADAGWYLYCNGRLLLGADKSALTGWGNGAAVYHPQYRRFRGYAFLTASDASLLPWNTTKTGVDESTHVFRVTQQEMISALGATLTVLNRAKKERQHRPERETPLITALAVASPVEVHKVHGSGDFVLPDPAPPPPAPTTRRIQYEVDREELDATQEQMGAATVAEVGRRTFGYYYDNEVRG